MRSLTRWMRVQFGTLRRSDRRRRRFLALGVVAATTAFGVFMITNALAVHDEKFELDGNVTTQGETKFSKPTFDWESFFNASGEKLALPEGFTASGFAKDFSNSGTKFVTADTTTFSTGSKDTLPISTGWECAFANNVLSKDDIMNAYANAYTNGTGEEFLYFGLERNANTGNGNVGIWFLQSAVGCESKKGSTKFTGDHATGDLLIVSEFTKGGGVSTINVYEWQGGPTGKLNPEPVAKGQDCTSKEQPKEDTVCATTNGSPEGLNGPITTPWLTANKEDGVGHTLQASEFFEGGLNLTKAKLGEKCFNVFLEDTRSSQSLTATLFDFARGVIGECTAKIETTPVESDGSTPIPAAGLPIPAAGTLEVKDKATITVKPAVAFNATVSFHLCGPSTTVPATHCDSGGVAIGTPQTVTANTTLTSAAATITSAGNYCWRADFSGDSEKGILPTSDSSATECFLITPLTPTLTTKAGSSPVPFGQAVTDKGTLSGTANRPGSGGPVGSNGSINPTTAGAKAKGTITFTLYKENCTDLATGTGSNPQTVNVNGDGEYGPVSFTPGEPGEYHWVATYGGDSPNTNASDSTAEDAKCGEDANEDVTVEQIPTEISTKQKTFPQDLATIASSKSSDSLPSGGKVTFYLYGPTGSGASAKTGLENCLAKGTTLGSGGLLFKEGQTVGGTHQVTPETKNTSAPVENTVAAAYFWRVTYETGDTAHTGRQSNCTENVQVTFTNDAGPGEVF